jgi:hypothetical protein
MMRKIMVLFFLQRALIFIGCIAVIGCNSQGNRNEVSSNDSLIQRIVCFKFTPKATAEQINQHMSGFAGLKDSIPYMLSYSAGSTVRGDLDEKGEYDVMHYSTYRSEEDIRRYSIHPVHLRFIEQNKNTWERVLVINSKIANMRQNDTRH